MKSKTNDLVSRAEAQAILGIKSPLTFWLRIARAGISVSEKRTINNVVWHFYKKEQIEGLKKR